MTILIGDIEDYTMGTVHGATTREFYSYEEICEVVVHVNVALESILASDLDEFDQSHVRDFIIEVLQGDRLTEEDKQYIKERIGEIKC